MGLEEQVKIHLIIQPLLAVMEVQRLTLGEQEEVNI
jgi:hypothetical protein